MSQSRYTEVIIIFPFTRIVRIIIISGSKEVPRYIGIFESHEFTKLLIGGCLVVGKGSLNNF